MTAQKLILPNKIDENEPLLQENSNPYSLFPVKHDSLWSHYNASKASYWTDKDLTFDHKELQEWDDLSPDTQHFLETILAFFATADGIVNENIVTNFYNEMTYHETAAFFGTQIGIETIHAEVYAVLIETYIRDTEKKNKLFNAINTNPVINKMGMWAKDWIAHAKVGTQKTNILGEELEIDVFRKRPLGERLIAFCCIENIFFSGAFCAIYWVKEQGILTTLTRSNELISRDEGLHVTFGAELYREHIVNKLTTERVNEIVGSAMECASEFICECLPQKLRGMNKTNMKQYLKFVADYMLVQLGHEKMYNVTNPFPFMEKSAFNGKTNFHDKDVSEYNIGGYTGEENTAGIDDNVVTIIDKF